MAPAPKQPKPADNTALDALPELDSMPVSPDGSMSKTVISVAGQKIVIERDDPAEEAAIAAKLLRLAPAAPAPAAPKGRPKKEATVTLSKMISLYFDEVKAAGTQQPKTIEENTHIFQLLFARIRFHTLGPWFNSWFFLWSTLPVELIYLKKLYSGNMQY